MRGFGVKGKNERGEYEITLLTNNRADFLVALNFCRRWAEGNDPEFAPRWVPVTPGTLPNPNSVVVVCGEKGTWDVGTYRGCEGDDIHRWWWKNKTLKKVYWWMYKYDALPLPYMEVENDENRRNH